MLQTLLVKLHRIRKEIDQAKHRTLIVLSGDREIALQLADQILISQSANNTIYFKTPDTYSPVSNVKALLGTDTEMIVVDAWGGFDPDAIGILTGTIKAGGICILITPPLQTWPSYRDPELQRIRVYPFTDAQISNHYTCRLGRIILDETKPLAVISDIQCRVLKPSRSPMIAIASLPTIDQHQAITAIHQLAAQGSGNHTLLITANRGRGKSSALGIAAAELQKCGMTKSILVTAPSRSAVNNLFLHAGTSSNPSRNKNTKLIGLQFISPDNLLSRHPKCDLLIVDEAAAIPLPILREMLNLYSKVIFSSTEFGYEGAGRGFALKFRKILSDTHANWTETKLETPVRYNSHDPLEAFTENLLMLDADIERYTDIESLKLQHCTVERFTSTRLLGDEHLLRSVFALLVEAHYQTKPLDLRHLLDGPNLDVYGLTYKNRIVAALLVAREGCISDSILQDEIIKGQRRPKGHLLPQILAYQHLQPSFLPMKLARVVRIAVHPDLQLQGAGAFLLRSVEKTLQARSYDAMGSTFGATRELLSFWFKNNYQTLHLGTKRNASSASYSAVVFKPFTERANRMGLVAAQRHRNVMESRRFEQDAASLIHMLLRHSSKNVKEGNTVTYDKTAEAEVSLYAKKQRDFEAAQLSLSLFFHKHSTALEALPRLSRVVIERRILNDEDWKTVSDDENLAGRRQCESIIRDAAAKILESSP